MKTLLGQRIREQRRKKGWTMDKLAEKADLSVNYVGDLERGVKTPSLDTFIRIVEALDVPADTLTTSANLSYHGQEGNIELGARIHSKELAKQVEDIFTSLVFKRIFVEL